MLTLDLTTWTTLLVALSPLIVAVLRQDTMNSNQVALLTVGVLTALFFLGKALDGNLSWPLSPLLAADLAAALLVQQGVYQVIKRTSLVQKLETI